ncbi:MAG: hypothetical protein JXR03_10065 [Cyclobacteriaceae bacterium]
MKSTIYILGLVLAFSSIAQKGEVKDTSSYIHQVNRIEFDKGYANDIYHIIQGEETGLLVAVQTWNNSGDGNQWNLNHLDTALNIVWTKIVFVPLDSYFVGYDFYDGKYYLLFNANEYDTTELLLYEIDAETTDIETYEINTVFPMLLSEFEVLNGTVLLAGSTNYKPAMLTYDFVEQKPKVIPGIYDKQGEILDLLMDDELGMFTVIISERTANKNFTVIAKTFTSSGDLIQENKVLPSEKQNIVDGVATNFYGGFQYMAGTYSKKSTTYSNGFYLAKFINGRQQLIKYHDYASLDNFFSYMNEKREQRMKEKIKKKAERGKNPNLSYRLLVHDIIQRGDEYLMIAEAYYPRYSNSYSSYSAYGRYSPNSRYNTSFMGFNFTHAVVVAFDKNGEILWDNSFSIDNVLTYGLEEFVSVSTYKDKVVLMYLDENVIHSKVVNENEIVEGKAFNSVKLAYENDELKSRNPEIEGLKPWYGDTSYAYGVQRIKNEKGAGGKIFRNIFYINKIQYHQDQNPN